LKRGREPERKPSPKRAPAPTAAPGGAALSRAALGGAALSRAALVGAALSRAALGGAALSRAALGGAALSRAALVGAARAVRRRAYAPYSRFAVGAAVWDEAGRIHVGCNVENASYGLTVCAERNAVAAAVAAGAAAIGAVAIVTRLRPAAPPCGACRQVLAELGGDDTVVLLASPTGDARELRLGDLLPQAFRLR
jgi:cytidine deaminase